MADLSWIASTPAGDALGKTAAATVHVVFNLPPWWSAPLEPLRWMFIIVDNVPHTFYAMAELAVLSFVFAVWWSHRQLARSVQYFAAVWMTAFLISGGTFYAIHALDTWTGGSVDWHVPPNVPFRLADLHSHSQASGGIFMPEGLVAWHYARGYRVMAISDSNSLRGVERAQQYIESRGLDMILVPAEEYRGTTHLLMFNLKTAIVASAQMPVLDAIRAARAQGAFVVVAHPWTADYSPEQLLAAGAQGFEVTNGAVAASAAVATLARQRQLADLGDLDYRMGNRALAATVLPLWADTPARVQQALAQGACAALYFPDKISTGGFHFWTQLEERIAFLVRTHLPLLFGGFAFWAVILFVWRRKFRGRGISPSQPPMDASTGLGIVAGLTVGVAGFSAWCMWWAFHIGWVPRNEWAIYAWAIASVLALRTLRRMSPGAPFTTAEGDSRE